MLPCQSCPDCFCFRALPLNSYDQQSRSRQWDHRTIFTTESLIVVFLMMLKKWISFFLFVKGVQINSTKRVPDEVFVWYKKLVPGTRVLFFRFRDFSWLDSLELENSRFHLRFSNVPWTTNFQILNRHREGRGWAEADHK